MDVTIITGTPLLCEADFPVKATLSKLFLPNSENGSTLNGKILLRFVAHYFISERSLFMRGLNTLKILRFKMNGYPVRGGNPLQKIVRSSEKLVWAKSEGLSPLHKNSRKVTMCIQSSYFLRPQHLFG